MKKTVIRLSPEVVGLIEKAEETGAMVLIQEEIGAKYLQLSEGDTLTKIAERKKELAGRLLILCHHYQQESLFQFADLSGDSLKLAREAAAVHDREYIVFCGVHFMAESADILAQDHQKVMLPHLQAGCPMADMASVGAVAHAYRELVGNGIIRNEIDAVPVTYVNSSAAIKAFVGERSGSVCTSSNAEKVLQWAMDRGEKVFFFPDEHLGRNSAMALGLSEDEVVLWRRGELLGGNSIEALRKARVLLWDGYCEVHMRFRPDQIHRWREREKDIRIMIHPECSHDVVKLADYYGSTEAIIKKVAESPAGSKWAIGTEVNLVDRLRRNHPDKEIHLLASSSCQCTTMHCNQPENLLWLLDSIIAGRLVNRILVDKETAAKASMALEQMLAIS